MLWSVYIYTLKLHSIASMGIENNYKFFVSYQEPCIFRTGTEPLNLSILRLCDRQVIALRHGFYGKIL